MYLFGVNRVALSSFASEHGCIKAGFTTDIYSTDRPPIFYSKRHVFEYNVWFTFCQVFKMSVT